MASHIAEVLSSAFRRVFHLNYPLLTVGQVTSEQSTRDSPKMTTIRRSRRVPTSASTSKNPGRRNAIKEKITAQKKERLANPAEEYIEYGPIKYRLRPSTRATEKGGDKREAKQKVKMTKRELPKKEAKKKTKPAAKRRKVDPVAAPAAAKVNEDFSSNTSAKQDPKSKAQGFEYPQLTTTIRTPAEEVLTRQGTRRSQSATVQPLPTTESAAPPKQRAVLSTTGRRMPKPKPPTKATKNAKELANRFRAQKSVEADSMPAPKGMVFAHGLLFPESPSPEVPARRSQQLHPKQSPLLSSPPRIQPPASPGRRNVRLDWTAKGQTLRSFDTTNLKEKRSQVNKIPSPSRPPANFIKNRGKTLTHSRRARSSTSSSSPSLFSVSSSGSGDSDSYSDSVSKSLLDSQQLLDRTAGEEVAVARPWPPQPGSVYCEGCFRNDCSRWRNIGEQLVDILRHLGDDAGTAVAVLRAETRVVDEAAALPQNWMANSIRDLPTDVKGLVLLHREVRRVILRRAARREAMRQERARKMSRGWSRELRALNNHDEVLRDLESLEGALDQLRRTMELTQQELRRLDKKFEEVLALQQQRAAGVENRYIPWMFDEALQDATKARRQRLALQGSPFVVAQFGESSAFSFDVMLAQKAREAAISIVTSAERAAREEKPAPRVRETESGSLKKRTRRLIEEMRLDMTWVGFWDPIKEKLDAMANRLIAEQREENYPSSGTAGERRKSKKKRARGVAEQEEVLSNKKQKTEHHVNDPQEDSGSSIVLACMYCSESEAVTRATRRKKHDDDDGGFNKPWIKPLMWTYKLDMNDAARATADDFFDLVEKNRGAVEVEPTPGLKILVDGTGGVVRVVLVEMWSVFDALLLLTDEAKAREKQRNWDRQGVQPKKPLGVRENWKGGKLKGFSVLH